MRKALFILFILLPFLSKAFSTIGHAVYFESGKSKVSQKDRLWLDSVSTILRSTVNYSISIQGYCDADGSEESNLILANSRSMNVFRVFMNDKLDKSFIQTQSFGEKNPVSDNNTAEGKAKNRRVELSIKYQLPESAGKSLQNNSVKKEVELHQDLSSSNLEVGKTLVLKNLNFEGGTPILLPESEPTLKELLKIMQDNPTMEIEIGGHVCCGPDMDLSIERAKRVYTYLKGHGIDSRRMSYRGYSFDKPIANESTEEGRTKNRRVEITILKM
jgi:outer membrane protein OmpA-like peptidoglycan-associated protein